MCGISSLYKACRPAEGKNHVFNLNSKIYSFGTKSKFNWNVDKTLRVLTSVLPGN